MTKLVIDIPWLTMRRPESFPCFMEVCEKEAEKLAIIDGLFQPCLCIDCSELSPEEIIQGVR